MYAQGDAVIQFGEYLDIYGEKNWILSTHCSKISPSLEKWNVSCRRLIGSDRWFLPTVLRERFIDDVRQRVGP